MIFERLADVVVRHHIKLLVLWVVVLAFVIPAVFKIGEVLEYQESEMVEGDTESLIAQRILDEQFPTALANSTIMIVLEGTDISSTEARDFCLDLEDRVKADGRLAYFEDFTSVYSVHTQMVYSVAAELGPVLAEVEDQVNSTASLLYGVPATHVAMWMYTDPSLTVTERDHIAYQMTVATLAVLLASADPLTSQLTFTYFSSFSAAWNSTSGDSSLVSDPLARAEAGIGTAAPQFIGGLPFPEDQKALMLSVLSFFDMSSFSNQTLVRSFTVSTVAALSGIDDTEFLGQVLALGPAFLPADLSSLARSVVESRTLSELPVELPREYLTSLVSPDNRTTLIVVSFSKDTSFSEGGVKPIVVNVDTIRVMVSESRGLHLSSDYTTYVTGDAALSADMEKSMTRDLELIEPITIVLIIVLMGYFFRSVVAQFIPLGGVMVALGVSQAMVFVIGSIVADVHYSVVIMLFSILMGIGTDYGMFIVARYREERIRGHSREDAVRTSVTWAGESITTSGATVMISFFALSVADFSMIRTMGIILGLAIGISLMVALTLVPSLLMVFGNKVFWPTRGERWRRYADSVLDKRTKGHHSYFYKAADFSIRRHKAVLAVAILISLPTSYIFLTAETSFDFIEGMSSGVESNQGIVAMTDAFGAGRIMPTEIVVVFDSPVYYEGEFDLDALRAVDAVTSSLSSVDNVKHVSGVTNPNGAPIDYVNLSAMSPEQRASSESLMLGMVGLDHRTVLFTVVLEAGPMSPESLDTVGVMRAEVQSLSASETVLASAEVYVGGSTALIHDLAKDLDDQFRVMEIIVVVGIFLVLLVVLGAVLLSLAAILSIALSITWAYAATVGLFGYALGEPILWILPLILFIMLMGIGMDYNVFILTRIREEIHKGKSDRDAIVDALDWTGGIITALAVIMGTAFSMMMISSTVMLKEIGFALAFAILLDAMVVRTYVVPAMMTLLGKWVWWAPGPLQRERRESKDRHRAE